MEQRPSRRLNRAMRLLGLAATALLAGAGVAVAHDTAEVHGTLVLVQEGRELTDGADQAVVFFTPAKRPKVAPTPPVAEMATSHKQFSPRTLVVPLGAKVRFPNQDPILHNVFSVSGGNAFDLGLVGKGPGKDVTFKEPGLVRIFCNVHQSMAGYVLVLDTPYSTAPDKNGAFNLTGLPAGPGTLSVWHERGEFSSQPLTLPSTAPVRLSLVVSKPRIPRHLNKFGKAYSTDSAY